MSSNKLKISKHIIIECKVECTKCKKKVSTVYINSDTISTLKKTTESWRDIKGFGTLCPQCCAHILKENI